MARHCHSSIFKVGRPDINRGCQHRMYKTQLFPPLHPCAESSSFSEDTGVRFSVPGIWFVHASDQWDTSTRDSGDFRKPFETQESTNCQIWDSRMCAKSLQLCLTLRDPMDRSLPGFSVQGILQARILEWIVMPSSRGPCQPRNWSSISFVSWIGRWVPYHKSHLGSPDMWRKSY